MRRLLLSSVFLIACSKNASDAPLSAPKPSDPAPTAPTAPADPGTATSDKGGPLPSGHHVPTAAEKTAPTEPARAGGLAWEAPPPFVRRAPKSSMRVAEYGLEGDPQAELGVFYFGPDQGGSVEANITRWVGQITQADGSETKPKRSERKVQGTEVALVEAQGVYSGGMAMPGAPAPAAIPDALLLGAIAKGPLGAVFFKMVGPRAAVESARGAFDGLIASIRNTEQPKK